MNNTIILCIGGNHAWANSKGKPLIHNKCGALAQVVDIFQLLLIIYIMLATGGS